LGLRLLLEAYIKVPVCSSEKELRYELENRSVVALDDCTDFDYSPRICVRDGEDLSSAVDAIRAGQWSCVIDELKLV
jgi:hypothetical protein